jgi:hypothetical protein
LSNFKDWLKQNVPSDHHDCHIGDDMDTLTVMNEDIVMETYSSNDARYQRCEPVKRVLVAKPVSKITVERW